MREADPIARLVAAFSRFPGVGEKSATRLAFFVLRRGQDFAEELAHALLDATQRVRFCERCMNFSSEARCPICQDPKRDPELLCVVASVQDLRAIEASGEFRGRYHVLHGTLAPLDGIKPEDIKLEALVARLQGEDQGVKELILATNPSVEGEATALYIQRLFLASSLKISRIASGLPIGGDFEYADPATISRALQNRRNMD